MQVPPVSASQYFDLSRINAFFSSAQNKVSDFAAPYLKDKEQVLTELADKKWRILAVAAVGFVVLVALSQLYYSRPETPETTTLPTEEPKKDTKVEDPILTEENTTALSDNDPDSAEPEKDSKKPDPLDDAYDAGYFAAERVGAVQPFSAKTATVVTPPIVTAPVVTEHADGITVEEYHQIFEATKAKTVRIFSRGLLWFNSQPNSKGKESLVRGGTLGMITLLGLHSLYNYPYSITQAFIVATGLIGGAGVDYLVSNPGAREQLRQKVNFLRGIPPDLKRP